MSSKDLYCKYICMLKQSYFSIYSTLHMQFTLSKEFHCMDVFDLFIFILQQSTFGIYFHYFSTYFGRTLFWCIYVLDIYINPI